jgi:hypothetical protein
MINLCKKTISKDDTQDCLFSQFGRQIKLENEVNLVRHICKSIGISMSPYVTYMSNKSHQESHWSTMLAAMSYLIVYCSTPRQNIPWTPVPFGLR